VYRRIQAPIKLPPWVPTPSNLRFGRALASLDRVVHRVIEKNRTREPGRDLLSIMMQQRDADSGEKMSDKELRDQTMTFLLAGHETTGAGLSFIFSLLSDHPAIEARLFEEVDTVLEGRVPTADDLPRLTYTGQIIDEAMRLYPPAWGFTRAAVEEDTLGAYRIPKGALLAIAPWVNHRLPAYWAEPDRFDPERFAPEHAKSRDAYHYFPFGGGPHLCIGKHLSLFKLKLAVAMIAQRYRLVREHSGPIATEARISLRPKTAIPVRVERRAAVSVASTGTLQ
jgi:cytochrome P450